MATKAILCVTWNLELQCPDDQALKDSFVDYVHRKGVLPAPPPPSLIVIGLQEAASYDYSSAGTFIGNRLVASSELLGKDYALIATGKFKGMTKVSQIKGHKAQQVIQILARKSENASARAEEHKEGKFWSEKGFCFARVTLAGRDLGFVSTHLDSSTDVAKKQREGTEILNFLKQQALGGKTFDALFMMGDLNFRISKQENGGDLQWVRDSLATPAGRDNLRRYNDTFKPAIFNNLPFIWPDFALGSLPTYKRKKDESAYNRIRQLRGKIDVQNDLVRSTFEEVKSDRPGVWDLGWLDRIGYAIHSPGQYNPVQGCGQSLFKARMKLENQAVALRNWYYVPYGDHTPVYCRFLLSGFMG